MGRSGGEGRGGGDEGEGKKRSGRGLTSSYDICRTQSDLHLHLSSGLW